MAFYHHQKHYKAGDIDLPPEFETLQDLEGALNDERERIATLAELLSEGEVVDRCRESHRGGAMYLGYVSTTDDTAQLQMRPEMTRPGMTARGMTRPEMTARGAIVRGTTSEDQCAISF